MKPIILVALICLAAVAELALARHSSLHEWAQYKRQHGKVYEKPEEDAHRFSLFLAAKERVQRHNANERASFKLGLNHLSDWTGDELARLNGFKYDPIEHMKRVEASRDHPFMKAILDDPAPAEANVDYRKDPTRVSPVKNQGQCGSCWAFATTGMLEGQQVVRNFTKSLIPLSEQEIMDCSVNDNECGGGIMSVALEDMVSVGGFNSEKDYPYEARDMFVCDFKKDKVVMTEKGSIELPNDEEIIRQFVAKYGPVAIAIEATDKFQAYTSGVFYDPICSDRLNHGVLIVGYGTDPDGGDYWIVKNSWSDNWGDGGYIKMKRGEGTCGIGLVSTVARFTK